MVEQKRKTILAKKEDFYIAGISLKDIKEDIDNLIDAYGENAFIDKVPYDYDEGYYFAVFVERYENDDEYEKRINREKCLMESRKKLYETLKREFEGE